LLIISNICPRGNTMSVAIVSSPAKPPVQSTPADNSAGSNAAEPAGAGADFAKLLLGQLAVGAELQQTTLQNPDKKTDEPVITTETSPQDAALMLASLGLPPQESTRNLATETETRLPASAAKDQASSLSPLPTALGASDIKVETGKTSTDASSPPAIAADDKPAKFAVPDLLLPKVEQKAVDAPASDASSSGLSTLASQAPNNLESATRNHQATLKVETPVRDHTWANDFGQKVVWLAANDKQSAQLTLNPPHMGPIEISLNLTKDTASAAFVSTNAEVRQTIEAALPRLREMLAGVGIELGQTNVGAESFRQQPENESARQGTTPRWMGDNAILGGDAGRQLSGQLSTAQRGNGMVDLFA
jgi:flagellar hook-length control protein FliK